MQAMLRWTKLGSGVRRLSWSEVKPPRKPQGAQNATWRVFLLVDETCGVMMRSRICKRVLRGKTFVKTCPTCQKQMLSHSLEYHLSRLDLCVVPPFRVRCKGPEEPMTSSSPMVFMDSGIQSRSRGCQDGNTIGFATRRQPVGGYSRFI